MCDSFFPVCKVGQTCPDKKKRTTWNTQLCVFFLQMLGGTSPLEALPLLLFLWCHISLPADMLLRGEEKYLVLLCFPLCLSSYIAALCLSHSLYGKGISCANKGGNVARWALGKFSDIQEERDEAQSAYCTLPQQRQHKGPNHCSTSLAGKQPVCCPFWYLHCGVCDSIYGFLQKRKIKSETRERESAQPLPPSPRIIQKLHLEFGVMLTQPASRG